METSTNPLPPVTPSPDLKDQVFRVLERDPHRPFTKEDLVPILKLQSPKDPEKQAQATEKVGSNLRQLVETGQITEVAPGLFKARLFFDDQKMIEHAFIGGMGNTRYRFHCPIFRLNIGVLSVFFLRDPKKGEWYITVRDTTIGKDYAMVRRLPNGQYSIGGRPAGAEEKNHIQIAGRYIEKEHLTLSISGEDVSIEDHNTPYGTRIDHLTKDGLGRYQQAAGAFLKSTDPVAQKDSVKRGRFALEQFLHHHQNLETSFFSAVVDFVLMAG